MTNGQVIARHRVGRNATLYLLLCMGTLLSHGAERSGSVFMEVTDILQNNLPSRVELHPEGGGNPLVFNLKNGKGMQECPTGKYVAYVYAYDWDIPVLVNIQSVSVEANGTANLSVEVVEGTQGKLTLRAFDQDYDLVMDRVEVEQKTDPANPADFPGANPVPFESPVLSKDAGWYKGDLHVRSIHGSGKETVGQLVKRADKSGLDFIAITDRNTMASVFDSDFQSDKVVLIPALEWGTDERGVALIYGPRTFPELTNDIKDDQGVCQRVQAQGGIFAIAHPCFPNSPWQRGLSYVNAIEVWSRDWRGVPPLALDQLMEEYKRRVDDKLVYSISRAAKTPDLSANGQAAMFWDYELVRGLKACAIGGSQSSSPEVPMGKPLTYVYAKEKSVRGILEGLRLGRTYVSSDIDGPTILFSATAVTKSATKGKFSDIGVGGILPLGMPIQFQIQVARAKGLKVELLRNGWPILTKIVESSKVAVFYLTDTPPSYAVYRVRVLTPATGPGFGPTTVMAMTSPIYAQDIVPVDMRMKDPLDVWVKLENKTLPPVEVTERSDVDGKVRVRTTGGPPAIQNPNEGDVELPPDAQVKTLNPVPLR
ncbi:MAG: CehA/McbA family metallohydrolase [Candidatus Hydrogenedentes bacterium]|nr:CehA/McbA family metallohydrolase [Candidatus Hydrogenedentota bacterium]